MKTTQADMILRYMREYGSITPLDALREFGCMRLGARIWDLRQAGHRIRRDMEAHVNKFGEKVHYARYTWEG